MVKILVLFTAMAVMGSAQNVVQNLFLKPDGTHDACKDCLLIEKIVRIPEKDLTKQVCDTAKNQTTPQQCEAVLPPFFVIVAACGPNCHANSLAILKDFRKSFKAAGRDMKKVCADRRYCVGKSVKNNDTHFEKMTRLMRAFIKHEKGSLAAADDCLICRIMEAYMLFDVSFFHELASLFCKEMESKSKDECQAEMPSFLAPACDKERCVDNYYKILIEFHDAYVAAGEDMKKVCNDRGYCIDFTENCSDKLAKICANFEKDGSDIQKFCKGMKFCTTKRLEIGIIIIFAIFIIVVVVLGICLLHKRRNSSFVRFI